MGIEDSPNTSGSQEVGIPDQTLEEKRRTLELVTKQAFDMGDMASYEDAKGALEELPKE